MSSDRIINDCYFGQIKDCDINEETLKQFINDTIYTHPNCEYLLKNFSDIYVLIASASQNNLIKDSEKSWKEIMNTEQYNLLNMNNAFILGYMLINKKKHQHIHYIDIIDTIVRKNNLARVMMDKYYEYINHSAILIPKNIIRTSAKYWCKQLGLYYTNEYDELKVDKEDIDDFIVEYKLVSKELSWEYLYELCK